MSYTENYLQLEQLRKEKELELDDFRKRYHYVIQQHRQIIEDLFELTKHCEAAKNPRKQMLEKAAAKEVKVPVYNSN